MSSSEGCAIAIERMGVDIPIPPEENEVYIHMRRVATIENLPPNLESLSIVACILNSMKGIEECIHLKSIDLSQNKITKMESLQNKSELQELDLSFNEIKEICDLSVCSDSLVRLRLQNNEIHVIPAHLRALKNLVELELGSNKISIITNMPSHQTLEELWLGRNRIKSFQIQDEPLSSETVGESVDGLTSAGVSGTACSGGGQVEIFDNLRILSLQNNLLTTWDGWDNFICQFPHLEELYLSENFITPPLPITKSLSPKLLILDLSSNKIQKVGDQLPLMTSLKELWLSNNLIEDLDEIKKLKTLVNLETVYFEGNPFKDNLGPGYRQFVLDLFPNIKQIDAIWLGTVIVKSRD